ncbi:MAG: hypothetical protein WAJ93_04240 [Candidatus Nitrosopolaris sp.]
MKLRRIQQYIIKYDLESILNHLLHLLFDEQADAVLDSVDIMAERVRRVDDHTKHQSPRSAPNHTRREQRRGKPYRKNQIKCSKF